MIPAPRAQMADHIDDKITVWSKRIALVLLGWFASSAYHGTLTAARVEKAVPALQAQAGCEEWRAQKNGQLALQNTLIDKSQLVPDKCPHPKVDVPPVESPLVK